MATSISIHAISFKNYKIDNELLLDGGISDSIPIQKMQEMGFEKNIVILTQEKGYAKKANSLLPIIKRVYKKYPELIKAIENRHLVYNQQLEYLEEQEKSGKVIIIRPSEKPVASRTEKDKQKILETYNLGKKDALSMLENIIEYMK